MIKGVYEKPTADTTHNGGKSTSFPQKIRNKTEIPTMAASIQQLLKVLTRSISKEKEIEAKHIGKEEFRLSLFTGGMILYIENSKKFTPPPDY